MPRRPGSALIAAAAFALACEPPPTEEQVEIAVSGDPVLVDVDCDADACGGTSTVDVEVTFEEHPLISDEAELELLQYRVDYDVPDLAEGEEIPYFASDRINLVVLVGEPASATLDVAGTTQRAWADSRLPNEEVAGTAVVTLAGYDHRNAIVELQSEPFDVRFDDYVVEEPTP